MSNLIRLPPSTNMTAQQALESALVDAEEDHLTDVLICGYTIIKELAVQKYAADNYRRLLDEADNAYSELKEEVEKWKTKYSNAMDVNTDLRAKIKEKS